MQIFKALKKAYNQKTGSVLVRTQTGLVGKKKLERNGLAEVLFIKPHLEDQLAGYTRPVSAQLYAWANEHSFDKITLVLESKHLVQIQ